MPWELIPETTRKLLEKQKYFPAGKHSGVKLCHWTKEALLRNRHCYKQEFYGISTHRCLQMSPALVWCDLRCLHCWRPSEHFYPPEDYLNKINELDDPETIVEESIKAHQKIIKSFSGLVKEGRIDEKKFEEAMNPNQVAISLVGEPLLYPKIDELVDEFKKRGFSTFVVSNGLHPEYIENITSYPTNLYISVLSTNEEQFKKLQNPYEDYKKAWNKFLRSVELLSSLRPTSTNTVFRITLIKDINDKDLEGYAKLVERGSPKFVEVKAYMPLGYAQYRLGREYSPTHEYIRTWAEKFAEVIGYELKKEVPESRVVLLVG